MAALATADELKAFLRWRPDAGVADDDVTLLELLLDAATATLLSATGRKLLPEPPSDLDPPVTKVFTTYGDRFVRIPDLRPTPAPALTLSGLQLTQTAHYVLDSTPLSDEPACYIDLGPAWSRYTFLGYPNDLSINGWWGVRQGEVLATEARKACLSLAARVWHERDAGFADQVVTAEGGALNYFRNLPGDVQSFIDRARVKRHALVGESTGLRLLGSNIGVGTPLGAR